MIHIIKYHEYKVLRSNCLLRNSEFNGDHHCNLICIFEQFLRFVDYQNIMFH